MRWSKLDLEKYVQAKEYVDTLLVPLTPYQLSDDPNIKKHAHQSEVLSIFLSELEKELTGRTMLIPSYHFLEKSEKESEVERLNTFIEDARKQPFSHVFLITSDPSWKRFESNLDGELLWWPGISSGDIHTKEMHMLIHDQVQQFSELIRSFW